MKCAWNNDGFCTYCRRHKTDWRKSDLCPFLSRQEPTTKILTEAGKTRDPYNHELIECVLCGCIIKTRDSQICIDCFNDVCEYDETTEEYLK
jgi:hypothetical protein